MTRNSICGHYCESLSYAIEKYTKVHVLLWLTDLGTLPRDGIIGNDHNHEGNDLA